MPWIVIPFGIFIACVFAQFWLVRRLRQALIERHPQVWLEISYKAWFLDNAMVRFAFGKRLKQLDDPVLDDRVRSLWLLMATGIAAWLAIGAMIVTQTGPG
jgi:hypothetical protein